MKYREHGFLSLPLYVVVAVVLSLLFLGSLFAVTRYGQGQGERIVPEEVAREEERQKATQEKKQAEKEAKEAEVARQAEAAQKAAEEKAAQATSPQPAPATTPPTPNTVASTGPEDTVVAILGVIALSYAGYSFLISRKQLSERLHNQ